MQISSRKFKGDTRATAAVEFAIVGPALILLTVGCIEMSTLLFVKHQLSDGVDRIRRLLQINPSLTTEFLKNDLSSHYTFRPDQIEIIRETVVLTNGETSLKVTVRVRRNFRFVLIGKTFSSISSEAFIGL